MDSPPVFSSVSAPLLTLLPNPFAVPLRRGAPHCSPPLPGNHAPLMLGSDGRAKCSNSSIMDCRVIPSMACLMESSIFW